MGGVRTIQRLHQQQRLTIMQLMVYAQPFHPALVITTDLCLENPCLPSIARCTGSEFDSRSTQIILFVLCSFCVGNTEDKVSEVPFEVQPLLFYRGHGGEDLFCRC